MTDAEQQEIFVRLERLKRSNRRWKALATVLGVLFLLLLSLGLVASVALDRQMARALQAEVREREAAEEAAMRQRVAEEQRRVNEAEARKRAAQGVKGQAEEARPRRPAGDNPGGP
jgi:triphosphoribosyl-dephospho-CoA synthetase